MKSTDSSELIAQAFDDWLKAEVVTSGEGRNKYLDASSEDPEEAQKKFEDIRRRLALPYDDDDNWNAQKHISHVQQRVPLWAESFEETVGQHKADYYAAQALFAPLMTTSGSYRVQSYLQSKTPDEYRAMRASGIGINLEKAIGEKLMERGADKGFSEAQISFGGLKRAFDYAYTQTELYFRGISARLNKSSNEFSPDELSLSAMKKSQVRHVQLATDCVIMAAKLRKGDLSAVPFLEPLSISDQSGSVYCPLRERVDWLSALSNS